MAFVGFADDSAMYDSTAFDNMFIIEYMPAAPGAFVKVFMYARMLCFHPELGGADEMKRALHMSDEELADAFTYWERAGLICRVSDDPPQYRFLAGRMSPASDYDRDYYRFRDFNSSMQGLFGEKLMQPAHYEMAHDWMAAFGFSQEAVLAILRHTIERSRSEKPAPASVFRTADRTARRLGDAGFTSIDDVEREFSRDERAGELAKEVIKQLGLRRRPSEPEIAMASKWLGEWQLDRDAVIDACAATVKAQNPSFGYIDSILKNRREGGSSFEAMRQVFSRLGTFQTPTEDHSAWYAQRIAEGFSPETILFAASQQARRRNNSLDGLDKLLEKWRQLGLFGAEAAEEYVARNRALYNEFSALLSGIGVDRTLSVDEVSAYGEWKKALPMELIAHAAACAAGKKSPVDHMARLIDGWRRDGISTVEDARKAGPAKKREKSNPALDYMQRDDDWSDFRDDRFIEMAREFENGEKKQ